MERRGDYWFKNFLGIGAVLVCFLLLLSALRLAPVDAQQPPPSADTNREQELDTKISAFFTAFMRGNTESAFQELLWQSPFGSASAGSALVDLRNKAEETKTEFGDIYRWEKFETKRFGEDVVMVRYVLKHEQYPVLWTFVFYRKPSSTTSMTMTNPNAWVLVQLRFDTDIM